MSASTRTSPTKFSTVRSSAGDTVTLRCKLSPELSGVTREIRWFKGTECIHHQAYEDTETGGCVWMSFGRNVSLTLRDVKVRDSGQYRCEAHGERKEVVAVVDLHIAAFKLVSRSDDFELEHFIGNDVTLPCHLSPKMSAVAMEIRWSKGTDCICLYQNGQVKEGKGYEGRVSLFTHKLQEGNVSLMLRRVHVSDVGSYKCAVTHGRDKVENDQIYLRVSELTPQPDCYFGFSMTETSIAQPYTVYACAGDDVSLSCHLCPETSAVAMEIRWFKGTDCICLYQNRQVKEGKEYKGRVSLFTHKLKRGNVSLMLRKVQESDGGVYKCAVTRHEQKMENSGVYLHMSEFKLVHRSEDVGKPSGSEYGAHTVNAAGGGDVTLPCYLSPKMSAVAMEIRWFKGTVCICLYQNGQVKEGKGYEGRVSLFTHELEEGNVSLMLRNVQESGDEEEYKCVVTCGDEKVETSTDLYFPDEAMHSYTVN
ncbi:hypothetical protein PDJAM_G00011740 [Pangasius djambal]|uniref:Uncharacterized protein n=1 Tax=Pangasius djambal TaxID=1691987 RepID=A0ACC5Y0F2_9TELE|nr:hypothetical protein [Pangasius djambal]